MDTSGPRDGNAVLTGKRRVLATAILIAACGCASVAYNRQRALAIEREVLHIDKAIESLPGESVSLAKHAALVPTSVQSVRSTSSWLLLLVPLLGFLAVVRDESCPSLAFAVCGCCCGILTCVGSCVLCSLIHSVAVFGMEAVELFGHCDVLRACPLNIREARAAAPSLVNDTRAVDCLAANIWPEYTARFEYSKHAILPETCRLQDLLSCGGQGQVGIATSEAQGSSSLRMLISWQEYPQMPDDPLVVCLVNKDAYDRFEDTASRAERITNDARLWLRSGILLNCALWVTMLLASVSGKSLFEELRKHKRDVYRTDIC